MTKAYLQSCQEYAEINKTYYNMTCFYACENLEKNIYLLNCNELYNYSEFFLNVCFSEKCNDVNIKYILNNVIYDINNLLNTQSCRQNITAPCNIYFNNKGLNITYGFIFIAIIIFISLTICTCFNFKKLLYYYRSHRLQSNEEPLII